MAKVVGTVLTKYYFEIIELIPDLIRSTGLADKLNLNNLLQESPELLYFR